jgi:hypothetical protein
MGYSMDNSVKFGRLVNVAYVEYGDQWREKSLIETLEIIRLAKMRINSLIVVDNKGTCTGLPYSNAREVQIIAGDNRSREFGGWDDAFFHMQDVESPNAWLFVNDTFVAHRRARLVRRLRIAKWLNYAYKSDQAEMFGQVDPLQLRPAETPFGLTENFLCSYFFGMNSAAVTKMFPLSKVEDRIEDCLNEAYSPAGLFRPSVHPAYRENLEKWLHRAGNWRNAQPLTADNFSFLRLKAKSILFEHSLLPQGLSQGVAVHDIFEGKTPFDSVIGAVSKKWIEATALKKAYQHFRQVSTFATRLSQ